MNYLINKIKSLVFFLLGLFGYKRKSESDRRLKKMEAEFRQMRTLDATTEKAREVARTSKSSEERRSARLAAVRAAAKSRGNKKAPGSARERLKFGGITPPKKNKTIPVDMSNK